MEFTALQKAVIAMAFVAGFFLLTCASVAIHLSMTTEPSASYKDFVKFFGGFSIILAIGAMVPAFIYMVNKYTGKDA